MTCKICGYPTNDDYCSPVHKMMAEAEWIRTDKRVDKIQTFAEQVFLIMEEQDD